MGNQPNVGDTLKEVNLAPDAGSVSKKRKTVPLVDSHAAQAPLRIILLGESGVGMTRIASGLARGFHEQVFVPFHQAIADYCYANVFPAAGRGQDARYTRVRMYCLDTSCFPPDITRRALTHTWSGTRCDRDDEEGGLLDEEKQQVEEIALEKALRLSYNGEMDPTWDAERNQMGQFFSQVSVFLLVFSLVDPSSFVKLRQWKILVAANPCFNRLPVIVVGTKTDARSQMVASLAADTAWSVFNPLTNMAARMVAEKYSSDINFGEFLSFHAVNSELPDLPSPLMQLDPAVLLVILRNVDCPSLLNAFLCCRSWNALISSQFEELFSICSLNSSFVTRQQGIRLARMLGASKYLELNCCYYKDSQERSRMQTRLSNEHSVDSIHSSSQPEIDFLWACAIRTAMPDARSIVLGKFD